MTHKFEQGEGGKTCDGQAVRDSRSGHPWIKQNEQQTRATIQLVAIISVCVCVCMYPV